MQTEIQDDEIDLREIFRTLWAYRFLIIVFTLLVTMGAAGYAFTKTPTYEAKAIVEIGSMVKSDGNRVKFDDGGRLAQELSVVFVDSIKQKNNAENKDFAEIYSINPVKKQDGFIEIKAYGSANAAASNEIKNVLEYIRKKEQKDIDAELKIIQAKIKFINKQLKSYKALDINETATMKQSDAADLSLIEKLNKKFAGKISINVDSSMISGTKNNGVGLLKDMFSLEEQKQILERIISNKEYTYTSIVANIITNDHPVKPKKKLIIAVAFVSGFILSIFLVFFIEFAKGFKEEEK